MKKNRKEYLLIKDFKKFKKTKKKHKNHSISIFRLLFHLSTKKEIILMIIGTIGSIISAISGPIMSYYFGKAINSFYDIRSIKKINKNSKKTKIFINKIDSTIKKYLLTGIILFISNFIQEFSWQYSAFLQIHKLKRNYFLIIMRQEQKYFDNNNSFELVTKVQNQLQQIELGLGDKFGYIIQKIFNIIVGMTISFLISWKLSLIILTVAPLTIFLIIYFTKVSKNASRISKEAYQKAGGMAEEMLYNIQTIFSFANFDFELERFNKNIDIVFKCDKDKALKISLSQSIMGLSSYLSFTVAIFFGKKIIIENKINKNKNELKVGDILVVILSMSAAIWSLIGIAPNLKIIIDAVTSSKDYFKLLERKPKIHNNLSPIIKNKDTIEGIIEFKNVNFSYDNTKMILNNFTLTIEPGKKIALVGESGCGKSTVVNLLERIYEIDYFNNNNNNKEIINDIETIQLKEENIEFYHTLFGYVQQEPVLFNRSIKDNIIFGREKSLKKSNTSIDILVKEACDIAHVSEFLNSLEGGLNFKVGIQGNKLSGGQKQRIAIARAVLLKPKIIILDEATSALDYKNELEVQKALDNLKLKNITTFVISHRLNTIINSDIIYYMKDGKIIEKGNHKELFKQNGFYKKMIQNQVDEKGNLNIKEEEEDILEKNHFEKKLIAKRQLDIYKINPKKNQNINISLFYTIYKLFEIIQDKKKIVIIGIISSVLLGICITLSGYFFGFTIYALSQRQIYKINSYTNLWGTLYSLNSFLIQIFLFLKIYCLEIISSFLTANLRKMILKKYIELNMSFYDMIENSPGALLSKLSLDTIQLNSIFQMIVGDLFHSFGSLISGLVLASYYDWRLTLVSCCFIPFIITSNLFIAKTRRSGNKLYKKNNIEAGAILSESVLNTKTIFAFNFQKESIKLYMEVLNSEKNNFVRDSILLGLLLGFGIFCSFANHSALFYFSKKFFLQKNLDYKTMNITIHILDLMTRGITSGIRSIFDIKIAKNSFISIFDLLNINSEIDHTSIGNKNKIMPNDIQGKIEFKNVYFKYPINLNENEKYNINKKEDPIFSLEKKKYVLKDISFTINPGEKVALIGSSGSGKTTIIKLLERFYEPSKGHILIDGIDIKNYNLYELRKIVGLVNQDSIIFKRNIYDNIKYGNINANHNSIIEAAKNASIDYLLFNSNIINNSDENISYSKSKVSGGEKQRISIARIFLKKPKILLLDEPTSFMDKKNENEIIKNLDELMKGRTTLIATHRMDSIINASKILVFKHGQLIQNGIHKELINVEGEYKNLFALS